MLLGWAPKKSGQDEKHLRLDFEIPLIDDNRDGILPAWLIDPLASMERSGSAEIDTYLSTVLDGISLEFWATDKSPERMLLVTSATLRDFSLQRVTRDSKTFIALCCNTNVKRDWKVLRFADQHEDCYVWIEFTATEPNLPPTPDSAQLALGEEQADEPANAEPICGKKVGRMVCKLAPHGPDVAHELEEPFVEQTGEEAATNLKEFTARGRDKAEVSKAIKEASALNEAHVAKGAKAKDEPKRPRGF